MAIPPSLAGAIDRLCRGLAFAGGAVLLALALLVSASVLRRWLTTRPIAGDFELVQTGLAVAVFACLPLCHWRGRDIAVDVLVRRLSPPARRSILALWSLTLSATAAVLAWRLALGAASAAAAGQTTMVLALPIAPPIAVAAALAAVLAVVALLRAWLGPPAPPS